MSIACAKDEIEVVQFAATAMRIVLGIGAYGEAADDSGGTGSTTLALRLKYEDQGTELVNKFPGTHISAITDPRSISIVGPSARLHELFLYATEQEGIQVQKMEVRGQVHNPDNAEIALQLSKLCLEQPALTLPDASSLQVQVRSNITGQQLEKGSLAKELVTTILASRCEWYNLLSNLAKDMENVEVKTPSFVYFGLTDCVPLPPFHKVGIRPTKTAAHTLIQTPRKVHKFNDDAIAVVGASCRLPGANNMDELWEMLANGEDRHQELPNDRFDLRGSFRATQSGSFVKDRTFYGNLIDDVSRFDNGFFGVNPREAVNMDPQQRILLELAYEALEDAGYTATHQRERGDNVGCFIGASFVEYLDNTNVHPPTAYTSTGTIRAFLCGRISYYYGWSGPAEVIDTACSSSLVAINRACKAVQNGECDMALTGGINIITGMNNYFDLAKAGFLSPTGQCKPFDASADGYCRSDGAGLVVVKRLKDAVANGDPILGVIAGTATNQGGLSSSITVPHSVAQQRLYRKVLDQANIAAERVTYVETHGTGTQAGDPLEVESIRSIFKRDASKEQDTMYLGSIKGNIGHCETAAGVAGLLKVLAMIKHRQLPPQANHNQLNPKIPDLGPDGLAISRKVRSWDSSLRASLVNSYGAAGSNAALLCCEWQPEEEPAKLETSQAASIPMTISAATPSALIANARTLSSYLRRYASTMDLVGIASALNKKRANHHKLVAHIEATSIQESITLLDALDPESISNSLTSPSPVVLVFSGQYDNKVGLNRSFYDKLPIFRHHVDVCDAEVTAAGYPSIVPAIFNTEPASDIVALQCSIFAMQYASAQCWIAAGVKPAAIVGHSLGELTGLTVSGVLSLADAIKLVANRAHFIREKVRADNGGMLVLSGCSTQDFETICWLLQQRSNSKSKLEIACYNGPTALVVAGSSSNVNDAEDLLQSEPTLSKIRVKRLATTHGFHSSLMEPILADVDELTKTLHWNEPGIPLETCTISQLESFSSYSPSSHVRDSVYFYSAIRRVEERLGDITWLEAGIDTPIIGMVSKAISGLKNHKLLAMKTQNTDVPVNGIGAVVASLRQSGHNVSHWSLVPAVSTTRSNKHVWLPPYQFDRTQHWLANVDRVMEMQAEMQKNATVFRSENLGPKPTAATQLVAKRLGSSQDALEFVINTRSSRFRSIVGGHAVRSRPLCPASMYMESIVAALHLGVDGAPVLSSKSKGVAFKNFNINAPLGKEPDGEVVVQLKQASSNDTWDFTVRTLSGDATRPKITSHATGEVSLRSDPDFGTLQRLSSSLTGRLEQCRDLEKLMAKRAYSLFGRVVNYSDFFRGIASISIHEHEALADVRLPPNQPDRDESPVWSICDTVTLDTFIQVVGLLMNSDETVATDEVVVMVGLQSSMVSSEFDMSKPPEYWRVYAKFEVAADGQPLGDVFVSTPEGRLVATMCGCKFVNLPIVRLEKMLDSANHKSVSPVVVVSSPSSSSGSEDDASGGAETPLTVCSTPDSGEALQSLKAIVAEYTGMSATEIPEDKSLGELGLDSLASVELVEELSSAYGLEVDSEQLVESTIRSLYRLLAPKATKSARPPALSATLAPKLDAQVSHSLPDGRLEAFNTIIAEISGAKLSDIKPDETMAELGVDSLSAIDLKQELEDEFSTTLPDALVDCTVQELLNTLGIAPISPAPKHQPSVLPSAASNQANHPRSQSQSADMAPTLRSNPFNALKSSDAEFENSARKNGFSNYWSDTAPLQNRLMLAYIVEAFATLGVDLRTIQPGSPVSQIPFLKEKHDKLVPRLWEILRGHQIVSVDQQGSITRGKAAIERQSAADLQQIFLAKCPRYQDEAALIGLTGPKLADCLIGNADGVQLMFGSANAMKVMANYYSQSPMISTLTDQLIAFITSLLRTTGGKPARILEVGAGTGGTTKRLAAALVAADLPVSYTFTDISPSLVSKAKKALNQYPWMEYTSFDLEKDVPHFLRSRFDIVIGTNCVHATSDSTATCARLRQTLNPGGIIVLSEVTTIIDWYDISFGLLDGWWLAENRTAYPIRPASAWMNSFAKAGFTSAGFSNSTSRESTSQQLLVACNRQWDVPAPVAQESNESSSQSRVETLVYKEVDGVQVHADVFVPAGGSSTPLPIGTSP